MQAPFLEPIFSEEHVLVAAMRLLEMLQKPLAEGDAGARVLSLLLFRVDGGVQSLKLGLAAPSRDPAHIAKLIALRLSRLSDGLSADFGFEAAAVHVLVAEPLAGRQVALAMDGDRPSEDGLASLVDRLQQRLGAGAVYQLHACESFVPERAEVPGPVNFKASGPALRTLRRQSTCQAGRVHCCCCRSPKRPR